MKRKRHLPRLAPSFYRGYAYVFWTHTTVARQTGWLDREFHSQFRECLLHASSRYRSSCPIYCLMHDHWHLIWIGQEPASDQLKATAFLRKHIRAICSIIDLQDRAHDHVIREDERARNLFSDTCNYVRLNPVRAGLVEKWNEYPYLGMMIAGYPTLTWLSENPLGWFWRIHNRIVDQHR